MCVRLPFHSFHLSLSSLCHNNMIMVLCKEDTYLDNLRTTYRQTPPHIKEKCKINNLEKHLTVSLALSHSFPPVPLCISTYE